MQAVNMHMSHSQHAQIKFYVLGLNTIFVASLVCVLGFLVGCTTANKATVSNNVDGITGAQWLKAGHAKYFQDKNYEGAVADYTEAIKANFADAEAYSSRALAKNALGDYSGAIVDFNLAEALAPLSPVNFYYRGLAKKSNGDYYSAILDFTQAIRLKADYYMAYNARGNAKSDLEEYNDAIDDYTVAIGLRPLFGDFYFNRSIAQKALGKYQQAQEDMTKAISLNGPSAISYYIRGECRRLGGDFVSASQDYDSSIQMQPTHADSYTGLAAIKLRQGDLRAALADIDNALKFMPEVALAHIYRAIICEQMGNNPAVAAEYELAIFLAGKNDDALLRVYAKFYRNLFLRKTARAQPTVGLEDILQWNDGWQKTIGLYLTKRADRSVLFSGARRGKEHQIEGQMCEAYYYAGMLSLLEGASEEAKDMFEKCIQTGLHMNLEYEMALFELRQINGR